MTLCEKCEQPIPKERLDVLPSTKTCVNCSEEEALVGFTVWDQCTPEVQIIPQHTAQRMREMERIGGGSHSLK